jgi:uncharacterized membrane protein
VPQYVYSTLGVIGAVLVLFGFYRISIGRWRNKSFWYELDNFVGALLLAIYQLHTRAFISVVVNIIWAIVAFRGLTPFAERYSRSYLKNHRK